MKIVGSHKIQEFAALAGVTVKALRHYDRMGLLKPQRSASGYRGYTERDLERLEQIVALKALGFPLKEIRTLLESPRTLEESLRRQHRALEEKHEQLGRAIRVLASAENSLASDRTGTLKKLIEVMAMQDGVEWMKRYYSTDEVWAKYRRYWEQGPSAEWQEIYKDINAALDADPASERAQTLADRWLDLYTRAAKGDPELQTFSPTVWIDRANWPASIKERLAPYNLEGVFRFIADAAGAARKRYFTEAAWTLMRHLHQHRSDQEISAAWQARVDLFAEINAAASAEGTREAQSLADRWLALVEQESAGDAELKAGILKTWSDRRNWPATLRWQMGALYMLPDDRLLACGDFLEKAVSLPS